MELDQSSDFGYFLREEKVISDSNKLDTDQLMGRDKKFWDTFGAHVVLILNGGNIKLSPKQGWNQILGRGELGSKLRKSLESHNFITESFDKILCTGLLLNNRQLNNAQKQYSSSAVDALSLLEPDHSLEEREGCKNIILLPGVTLKK